MLYNVEVQLHHTEKVLLQFQVQELGETVSPLVLQLVMHIPDDGYGALVECYLTSKQHVWMKSCCSSTVFTSLAWTTQQTNLGLSNGKVATDWLPVPTLDLLMLLKRSNCCRKISHILFTCIRHYLAQGLVTKVIGKKLLPQQK